jgi:Tol biopolymer transport system component
MGVATLAIVLLAAIVISGVLPALAARGGKPTTTLISRQSKAQGGAGGNASSFDPAVSATGRFVAFDSEADNLGGDTSNFIQAFLYDRNRKRLQLVARRNGGGPANGDSYMNGISGSGRFVVYSTDATNLGGPIQTAAGESNVYLFDRKRKRTQLISRQSKAAGGAGGDGSSFDAAISPSGRYVVFASQADNLSSLDPGGGVAEIYLYDRKRKRVRLVSRQSRAAGGAAADGESERPTLTPDGRFIAFQTVATNLGGPVLTNPADDEANVYVYDRKRRRADLVSRQSASIGGAGGDDLSRHASISDDGRFVAFDSFAANLGPPTATESNIYAYDRKRDRLQLISRRSKAQGGGGADAVSYTPDISASGRYVAFDTEATNLGGPTPAGDGIGKVYLYDRRKSRVQLVSRRSGRNGAGADDASFDPSMSPSGRYIAFWSSAGNLSPAAAGPPFASIYLRDRER